MSTGKTKHVSIRCDEHLYDRLQSGAGQEKIGKETMPVAVFTRSLLIWALNHYAARGCSLGKLFKELPDPPDAERKVRPANAGR